MPLVRSRGADLYYAESGYAGEPIVFVHGSWTDHHSWDAVLPALGRSFRVLTYDRRGHSQSPPVAGQGHIEEDVDDLARLIEHRGFAPAHVVGNSFGGAIALRLASRVPQLVASINVHEPPLTMLLRDVADARETLDQANARMSDAIRLLEAGDARAGAERFVEKVALGPGAWAQLPPRIRDAFVRNAMTWLDETREPDALNIDLDAVSRIEAPVMFTEGSSSPPMFRAILNRLQSVLPNARRYTFEGAGHVPHLSHTSEFARKLLGFVSAVKQSARTRA